MQAISSFPCRIRTASSSFAICHKVSSSHRPDLSFIFDHRDTLLFQINCSNMLTRLRASDSILWSWNACKTAPKSRILTSWPSCSNNVKRNRGLTLEGATHSPSHVGSAENHAPHSAINLRYLLGSFRSSSEYRYSGVELDRVTYPCRSIFRFEFPVRKVRSPRPWQTEKPTPSSMSSSTKTRFRHDIRFARPMLRRNVLQQAAAENQGGSNLCIQLVEVHDDQNINVTFPRSLVELTVALGTVAFLAFGCY